MCIDEQTLLKLLAGELPSDQRQATLAHLDQCPACRQLHAALQQTWDQLGQWEAPLAPADLTAGILAAARRESAQSQWSARGRIAAAILLAGGIGWSAGRWSPHQTPPVAVSTEEMAQTIGLDALGGDVGALSAVFPEDSEADGPSTTGGRS